MASRRNRGDDSPKSKITRESLRKFFFIFGYLKPYRIKFLSGFIAMIFSTLTSNVFPLIVGQLVDSAITVPQTAGIPQLPSMGIFEQIKTQFGSTHTDFINFSNIGFVAGILFFTLVLQSFFSFFRILIFAEVGEKALADLRKDLYGRILLMPYSFFVQRRVGELVSRISSDITLVQDSLTFTIIEFLRSLINLVIGISVIIYISPKLTGVMLACFPVMLVAAIFFGRFIRKLSKASQDQLAQSGIIVEETLQGIQNVKAFANEAFEIFRYQKSIDELVKITVKGAKYRAAFVSFVIFALFGAIIFILGYGVTLIQTGEITIGKLLTFIIFTTFVGASVSSFGELYGQLQKTIGATERVRELLDEPIEPIHLKPFNENFQQQQTSIEEYPKIRGDVHFRNVSFSYPIDNHSIETLKGIDINVKAGERIALVGPSGAGKSTIASLLLRLYNVSDGEILIDGKPIDLYDISFIRSQMSVVPQDVFLFGGTIRENIAYGKLDATDEEIIESAKKANAHEFIDQIPGKYSAIVGERGVKLSGGQKQRIAIARAVLKNPAILILDEATSALDSESEKLALEALDQLMQNRTTFIIAHRLATIRNADRIIVIQKGKTIEQGTHLELMNLPDGVYKSLATLQLEFE